MRTRLTTRMDKTAAATGSRRDIPGNFKYNKGKLKHVKHMLHNINVALGTLVSALAEFSRVKGPDISPDGLIGGVGYILPITTIKENLNKSIQDLSAVADSLADELTNPGWGASEDKEVKKLIKEKDELEDKVEEIAETAPSKDESTQDDTPEGDFDNQEEPEEKKSSDEISVDDVITAPDLFKQAKIQEAFDQHIQSNLIRFNLQDKN